MLLSGSNFLIDASCHAVRPQQLFACFYRPGGDKKGLVIVAVIVRICFKMGGSDINLEVKSMGSLAKLILIISYHNCDIKNTSHHFAALSILA
jgi:hypothetical protein